MEKIYIDTAKILKAISDPKRLKIVDMLSCREQCAGKLQQAFCVTQPTLSHDMKVLVESGLILDRRNGKNIYYSLNPEALRQLYTTMGEIFKNKPHCVCEEAPAPVEERMENSL
ncbi:helix-turn-helix transcriptional regulator [uncultured Dialister sp.]|uniref:ArsR/SmtB family transcription factor n=1 Tax=uncultured Dialister sp. TaxID=278064 RepID=UPI0025DC47AF|nr:metalloregulator ArsR/SmtB family transcription factor [uncultured Dialister sp.]